jgi:UDP-glucose 4-epimerase
MHFAAFVGESVERPIPYYENNVGGSTALFGAIAETRTTLVVFSSTCDLWCSAPAASDQPLWIFRTVIEQILSELDFR